MENLGQYNGTLAGFFTMKKIKILGFGAVVKTFLKNSENDFPEILFEIYLRSFPVLEKFPKNIIFQEIRNYTPDATPTFCCCSINEEEVIRHSKYVSSRLTVAKSNLQLIKNFIQSGYFDSGIHFILTNPSELIAEFIIHVTKNKNIFALGLSVDYIRYQKILATFNSGVIDSEFNLLGNHWHFPLINFTNDFPEHNIHLLKNLLTELKKTVNTEFQGFKPPISSGATALQHAISSLYYKTDLSVSGFIEEQNAVCGGILNIESFIFNQPRINKIAGKLLIEVINFHKETYYNLM